MISLSLDLPCVPQLFFWRLWRSAADPPPGGPWSTTNAAEGLQRGFFPVVLQCFAVLFFQFHFFPTLRFIVTVGRQSADMILPPTTLDFRRRIVSPP